MNIKKLPLYFSLCFLQCSFLLLSDFLLIDDSLYYDFWQSKLSYERIQSLIEAGKKWKWISYAAIPVFLGLKCFLVAICLYTGAFFRKSDKGFGDFYKVALVAEFVMFIPLLVKIAWFGFIQRAYTLEDLSGFAPLSVLSYVSSQGIDPWFIYPLQLLNVFELLYWCALAYQLKRLLNTTFPDSFSFVASTYGMGLFIWVLFIMFLLVSIS
jgi:hypothetical protein